MTLSNKDMEGLEVCVGALLHYLNKLGPNHTQLLLTVPGIDFVAVISKRPEAIAALTAMFHAMDQDLERVDLTPKKQEGVPFSSLKEGTIFRVYTHDNAVRYVKGPGIMYDDVTHKRRPELTASDPDMLVYPAQRNHD